MSWMRVCSLLIAIAIACTGSLRTPIAAIASTNVPRIMPLGDSMTVGFDAAHQDLPPVGYRAPLYRMLIGAGYGFDFVGSRHDISPELPDGDNNGYGGAPISLIAQLVPSYILENPPDVVLLLIGANGLVSLGPQESAAQLERLIILIGEKAPRSSIVLSTLPMSQTPYADTTAYNQAAQIYNSMMPGIVAHRKSDGQRIVLSTVGNIDTQGDGLHPSVSGYAQLASRWFDALTPVLDQMTCSNPVAVAAGRGSPGSLLVTIAARSPRAPIRDVSFGRGTGTLPVNDLHIANGSATFTLQRSGNGASNQQFTVFDMCGAWPTFVGGGPSAF